MLGSFQYPRAELDMRKYFTLHERPDGSGRSRADPGSHGGLDGRQHADLRSLL